MDDMYSEYIDENCLNGVLVNPFFVLFQEAFKVFFFFVQALCLKPSSNNLWIYCHVTTMCYNLAVYIL